MTLMSNVNLASRAYATASTNRTTREQEADIFRLVIGRLQAAGLSGPATRIRALADNRRLWTTISDLMRDNSNPLPPGTRAGLISVGLRVQREMDSEEPSFEFLISVNKHIAEGLSGNP
jgi:flagellar biosynthesis regulator FlaF